MLDHAVTFASYRPSAGVGIMGQLRKEAKDVGYIVRSQNIHQLPRIPILWLVTWYAMRKETVPLLADMKFLLPSRWGVKSVILID